jgi:hypothetical protein
MSLVRAGDQPDSELFFHACEQQRMSPAIWISCNRLALENLAPRVASNPEARALQVVSKDIR